MVSEIGEAWSPATAPDKIAATFIAKRLISFVPRIAIAIGIKIPKVPQLVPVENAREIAIRKNSGGSIIINVKFPAITLPTKPPKFKYLSLQIPESVQARQRINIAGVMALNPALKLSQNALNVTIFRGRYKNPVNTKAIKEPSTRDFPASQSAKASATDLPS